ncbi:hypothetical protein AHiyo1_02040 [Arthrobacter sp. Hiyo1]|uniref:DUF2510 domain-containing protein n=1 Tax=Arthrobacter sp. Hiyo1 TaxID=1588020 RepID=UPI0007231ACE|nr:DUF2510 domain-containing protein [Arthrobacter sp. Hiyo1]GAP57363.1 hypothetical protein AHiyo1_02040 [Arthrobacter sp. Hiyo1]
MNAKVITSFVSAAVLGAATLIVGLIPYTNSGYTICPSALTRMTGGTTFVESLADTFTAGACTNYAAKMTAIMAILAILAVGALTLGLLLRSHSRRAAFPLPRPTAQGPAFWADDPGREGWLRWWDGSRFTDNWRPKE